VATAVWDAATRTLTAFGFTVTATADANVALIKEKTDNLPASPAAVGSAMTLANDAVSAAALKADAVAEIAAGILDLADGVETSLTLRQAMRLITAANAGKLSGAATTTIVIRNVGDTKDRITATCTSDGDRTAITTDLT